MCDIIESEPRPEKKEKWQNFCCRLKFMTSTVVEKLDEMVEQQAKRREKHKP